MPVHLYSIEWDVARCLFGEWNGFFRCLSKYVDSIWWDIDVVSETTEHVAVFVLIEWWGDGDMTLTVGEVGNRRLSRLRYQARAELFYLVQGSVCMSATEPMVIPLIACQSPIL